MNTTFFPNDLVELLREQSVLLEQLIEFGKQQREAIDNNRMSELLAILAHKQPQLDRLGNLREQLHNVRALIESEFFWQKASTRRDCQIMRDQAARLFETLIEFENGCEVALAESRNQIRHRLENIESGRAAANAYELQATTPPSPRIDFSSMG